MSATATVIFIGDDRSPWRLGWMAADGGHVEPIPVDASDPMAATLACLREHKRQEAPIVLAVPSIWCLAAGIDVSQLPPKVSREAMAYRLEEMLPLAIEHAVVDFVDADHHAATRLGICVEAVKLVDIVRRFDENGCAVEVICPAAILALQAADLSDDPDAIAIRGAEGLDLFLLETGRPQMWYLLPDRLECVRMVVSASGERSEPHIVEADVDELAVGAAQEVVAGAIAPWINLRHGPLAPADVWRRVRTPLRVAFVAAALLLMSASGALLWRAYGYGQVGESLLERQRVVFQETLPDSNVPFHRRSRLESEHRRLSGLSGASGGLERPPSALGHLHRLLTSLPSDVRYRVLDLRIEPERMILDGKARSHGDADQIARALRERGGFTVDAPRTERLKENGVGFMLSLTPAPKPQPESKQAERPVAGADPSASPAIGSTSP